MPGVLSGEPLAGTGVVEVPGENAETRKEPLEIEGELAERIERVVEGLDMQIEFMREDLKGLEAARDKLADLSTGR